MGSKQGRASGAQNRATGSGQGRRTMMMVIGVVVVALLVAGPLRSVLFKQSPLPPPETQQTRSLPMPPPTKDSGAEELVIRPEAVDAMPASSSPPAGDQAPASPSEVVKTLPLPPVATTTAKEPAMAEPAQPAEKSKQSVEAPLATPPEVPSTQATLTVPPPPSTTKNEDSQTVKRNIRGAEWIKAQAASNYTLQLMAVKDENTARQFIEDHHLQDKAAYLAVMSKGQTLYAVVYGSYPQRSGAARAAKGLPVAWGTPNPWIRSFKSLHGPTL